MKYLFLVGSLILGSLSQAQSDFTYKTSGQLLVEAYTYLGNEETEKAIDVFSEINESDSLYSSAQLSKLVSQFSLNDFIGAIESCDELLHRDLDLLEVAYEWKIKSLTKLQKFDNAHEIIAIGKKKYPLYFKYDFEKAKLLLEEKKYEEAKKLLQTILLTHPEHSASHYELANLMAEEGAKLEALLGYQMAIMINRSSTVLQKSYVGMEDVIQNNFEIKNEKAKNKYFKSINNMIESGLAIKPGYKSALNLNYMVDKVCDLIFNQFNYKKGTGNFSMEYYGKFFGEIKKQEL
ncbi:MAG: tetratricopeptide (TPR) repeat protein, partial [Flavobacteriales bacterium]